MSESRERRFQQSAAPPVGTTGPVLQEIPASESDIPSGTVLADRYRVHSKLGDGGMASVYLGEQVVLAKAIAIKVLHKRLCHDATNVERFLREARAASVIRHENVVDIIDFGQVPGGSVFIAMELLDGEDLDRLLERETRLDWPRTRNIMAQVIAALAAAHAKGIVHRDMKPANCYAVSSRGNPEFIKVLDFGIAKVNDHAGEGLTETGAVFGTAKYMAPEQACGEAVDARTDVYALGTMMYELLTGSVPFEGDNFMRVLTRHMNEEPQRPSERCPEAGIPAIVDQYILKALAKSPDVRFQSMREMAEGLASIDAALGGYVDTNLPKARGATTLGLGSHSLRLPSDSHPSASAPSGQGYMFDTASALSASTQPVQPDLEHSQAVQPRKSNAALWALSLFGGAALAIGGLVAASQYLDKESPTQGGPHGQATHPSAPETSQASPSKDAQSRVESVTRVHPPKIERHTTEAATVDSTPTPTAELADDPARADPKPDAAPAQLPPSAETADQDPNRASDKPKTDTGRSNLHKKQSRKASKSRRRPKAKGERPRPNQTEAGDPSSETPRVQLAAELSGRDLQSGLAPARKAAKSCGALATVKVRFAVRPDGRVSTASALKPHDTTEQGKCVVRAVKRARFRRTEKNTLSIYVQSFKL